jgi:hypothetical protein
VNQRCDFCSRPAIYDSPTLMGPWAFTCGGCFVIYTDLTTESQLVTHLTRGA